MAVRENGFRSVGKSQLNLQGQISFALPNLEAKPYIPMCAISMQSTADDRSGGRMFRCVLERGNHYSDDVTSIIMFDCKTGKSQVIAKGASSPVGRITSIRKSGSPLACDGIGMWQVYEMPTFRPSVEKRIGTDVSVPHRLLWPSKYRSEPCL
jgi:hypothetical protein